MKNLLFLLLFVPFSLPAQNLIELFNQKIENSETLYGTQANLTVSTGNAFDTLDVIIIGGSDLATDSTRATVYAQVYQLGRWSQGVLIDTIRALGTYAVIRRDTSTSPINASGYGMQLLADSLKARWFYSSGIDAEGKTAIMAMTDWKYRIYAIGKDPWGNSVNLSGGTLKVYRIQ